MTTRVEADAAPNIRDRVLSGFAWKMSSQVVLQGVRVVVAVFLARLLTPYDYGLAAMVLVFSTFGLVLSDLGFGAALIQRRTLSEQDRCTAFWTNCAVGVMLTLLGVALSGPIADFYGEPAVQPLFAVMSLIFILAGLESTQTALLNRDLHFRALEVRKMAGAVAGASVGITAAFLGAGPWSIIAFQLTFGTVSVMLVWTVSSWRPRFQYSFASLRKLGGYSSKIFGSGSLFFLTRNVDNMLIGRYLGATSLGLYNLAYNVMLFPLSQIAAPVQKVLFPAFSRLQDDRARVGGLWIRANRMIASLAMPASLGLIALAPDLVSVVLGDRWQDTVPIIQILALVGLLQSLQRLNGSVLQACDRAGTLLRFAILSFVLSVLAFVIGLRWGIVGVAACYAVATAIIQPLSGWLTARAVGVSLVTYARSLAGVTQASLVMFACVFATRTFLVHEDVPAAVRLFTGTLLGLAVFVPLCAWRSPEVVAEIHGLWPASRRFHAPRIPKAEATTDSKTLS